MAKPEYTKAEAQAALDWENRLHSDERRHLHVLDIMAADARDNRWKKKVEALHAELERSKAEAARLAAVVDVVSKWHAYWTKKGTFGTAKKAVLGLLRDVRAAATGEEETDDCMSGAAWDGGDNPPTPCGECPSCLRADEETP